MTPGHMTTPWLFIHRTADSHSGDAALIPPPTAPWIPTTPSHGITGQRNPQNWYPNWDHLPPPCDPHALNLTRIHDALQQSFPMLPGLQMGPLPQANGRQLHPGAYINRDGWQDLSSYPGFPIQGAEYMHQRNVNGYGTTHNLSNHHLNFSPNGPRQPFTCAPFGGQYHPGVHSGPRGTSQAGFQHSMHTTAGFQPPVPTCSPNRYPNGLLPAQQGYVPFPPTPPQHPPIHPMTPLNQQPPPAPVENRQYRLEDTRQNGGCPSYHYSLKPSPSKTPCSLEQERDCCLSNRPPCKETVHKGSNHLEAQLLPSTTRRCPLIDVHSTSIYTPLDIKEEIQSSTKTYPTPTDISVDSPHPFYQRTTTKSPGNKKPVKVASLEHASAQKESHMKDARATSEANAHTREVYGEWLNCVKASLDAGEASGRLGEPLQTDEIEHLLGHALASEVLEMSLPLATIASRGKSTATTNNTNDDSCLEVSAVHKFISTDVRTQQDFCYQRSLPPSRELPKEQTANNLKPLSTRGFCDRISTRRNNGRPPGFQQDRMNAQGYHQEEDAFLVYKSRSGCETFLPFTALWNIMAENWKLPNLSSDTVLPLQTLSSSLDQSFESFAPVYINHGDALYPL